MKNGVVILGLLTTLVLVLIDLRVVEAVSVQPTGAASGWLSLVPVDHASNAPVTQDDDHGRRISRASKNITGLTEDPWEAIESRSNPNLRAEIAEENNQTINNSKPHQIHVVVLRYDYVQNPLLITIFLLAICVLKIGFEHLHVLNQIIPESCLLMLLGLAIGCLLWEKNAKSELAFLSFSAQTFFLFLLPPIILEAAYSLKDRQFSDNLGTIMLYAILGTILNVLIVGPALYGLSKTGIMGGTWCVTFLECLMFATIVAAVDPVAVLAIFQSVGVNKLLYFLVFGESLFNDGVVVVLYNMIIEFMEMDSIGPQELGLGFATFLCVCVGATAIGLFMGFLCAFVTKFTEKIHSVEPFLLYGFAYLSYLLAELFDFSGIISLICCGLIQAHYCMENVSSKSYISVYHFSKVLSSLSESLIFIILSVMAINVQEAWKDFNLAFAALAVVFCILARFIVTYSLAYFVNRMLLGIRKIGKRDQFVMAYGGLRGAITFSLAFSLNPEVLLEHQKTRNVLLTSAYVVIFFTTFLQGITMKPIVKLLGIRLEQDENNIFTEINLAIVENTSAGIETILGSRGPHYLSHMCKYLSRRFLRPLVNRDPNKKYTSMVAAYQQSATQSAYALEGDQPNISIDIPRGNGHWQSLDNFDESKLPNAVQAARLDHNDAYLRSMLRAPTIVVDEDDIADDIPKPAFRQPVRGRAEDQLAVGALSEKIDIDREHVNEIRHNPLGRRGPSEASLGDLILDSRRKHSDDRRAALMLNKQQQRKQSNRSPVRKPTVVVAPPQATRHLSLPKGYHKSSSSGSLLDVFNEGRQKNADARRVTFKMSTGSNTGFKVSNASSAGFKTSNASNAGLRFSLDDTGNVGSAAKRASLQPPGKRQRK